MPNHYAEILRYQPGPYGCFEYTEERPLPNGDVWTMHTRISDEGLKQMILYAELVERWSDHLAAIQAALPPLCENHGLPIDGLGWDLNDCICDPEHDPEHVEFLLNGFHEELDSGSSFCVVQWVHSVPGGLIAWGREESVHA